MAERERLTNKERRALAREERRRKEAEAAAKAKRDRVRNIGITVVVVALVAAIGVGAFLGRAPNLDDAILISSSEAETAREAAGCEVLVEREPLPEAYHLETPPPEAELANLYPDIRPTHSGPHIGPMVNAVSEDGYSSQVSEVTTTHNLEHGAIFVWYDPAEVDGSTVSEIRSWNALLNNNGFRDNPQSGAGITSSPYEDPGISSGKNLAFRAWGTAMDCDTWDETVANAFVAEHYGTRGISPERTLGPYPDGTLEFSDRDLDDTTEEEAPMDGEVPLEDMIGDDGEIPEEGEEPPADDGDATDGDAGDGDAADDDAPTSDEADGETSED